MIFNISGGTGRFKDASGIITYAETTQPVLADAFNNPVFFASTGRNYRNGFGIGRERGQPRRAAIGKRICASHDRGFAADHMGRRSPAAPVAGSELTLALVAKNRPI